jgi:hypothetical protein
MIKAMFNAIEIISNVKTRLTSEPAKSGSEIRRATAAC